MKPSQWLYHPHCPGLHLTQALGYLFYMDNDRVLWGQGGADICGLQRTGEGHGEVNSSNEIVIVTPHSSWHRDGDQENASGSQKSLT